MKYGALNRGQRRAMGMALLTALAILAAMVIQSVQYITPGNNLPSLDNTAQQQVNATIKTQKTANSLVKKGAIRGIDVSQYQGTINWAKVAKDDVDFAMIRATVGQKKDTHFITNARNAHANGIKVGAYHYCKFTSKSTMKKEAQQFISQLKKVDITYPVAVDVEMTWGLSGKKLTELTQEFVRLVEAEGYTVMVYTYTNFAQAGNLNLSKFPNNDVWMANYSARPGVDHVMWQHTSYGSVKGISGRVDINIAYHDLAGGGGGLSSGSQIKVDKTVSTDIRQTLNSRYSVNMGSGTMSMKEINSSIVMGMQKELNSQLGINLMITGQADEETLKHLSEYNYTFGEKQSYMTYLVQAKLFYGGYYTKDLSGIYDSSTRSAMESYQKDNYLEVTGKPNYETLKKLLG